MIKSIRKKKPKKKKKKRKKKRKRKMMKQRKKEERINQSIGFICYVNVAFGSLRFDREMAISRPVIALPRLLLLLLLLLLLRPLTPTPGLLTPVADKHNKKKKKNKMETTMRRINIHRI